MQEINIPDYSNTTQNITLRGINTKVAVDIKYITREDLGWVLNIRKTDGTYLIKGIRLCSYASPDKLYQITELTGGGFYVLKKTDTQDKLGRTNFGLSKDYGLFWVLDGEFQ